MKKLTVFLNDREYWGFSNTKKYFGPSVISYMLCNCTLVSDCYVNMSKLKE